MNDKEFLITLDDILTKEECIKFMKIIDDSPKTEKVSRSDYAEYNRLIHTDRAFANILFRRIKNHLPEEIDGKKIVCLNDHIRLSQYNEGGSFKVHRDGFNQDSMGNRSICTVNIFLNEDFEGGETDFLNEDHTLRFRAVPKSGRGAIFYSQQLHRGNEVINGRKYLFRTDIMV